MRCGGELLAQMKAKLGGDRKSKGKHPPSDQKTAARKAFQRPADNHLAAIINAVHLKD
jgi:hypothetical protein